MNKQQILNTIDIIKIERNTLKNNHLHKVYLNAHQLDAIFGLLDLYKELEQNSISKKEVKENYIAKDKVKKLIKELEKEKKFCTKRTDICVVAELDFQIEILKELLEEDQE